MKKSTYKSAMSNVRISEEFMENTYRKLKGEAGMIPPSVIQKERMEMEKAQKRKWAGWTVGIAACAVLAVGILTVNGNQSSPTSSQPSAVVSKPPIMGKVAVNIDGVISEVSADGKRFKVGDLWVTITDQTQMGINEPTAAEPSEELLQKEFKIGNTVSGYTSEDVSTGEVNATRIYNNMAPQK